MCSLGTIGKTGANVNEPSNQYILFLELTSSTVVSPKLGMLLALANIYKPDPGMGHRTRYGRSLTVHYSLFYCSAAGLSVATVKRLPTSSTITQPSAVKEEESRGH
jgi:hypothetical protein